MNSKPASKGDWLYRLIMGLGAHLFAAENRRLTRREQEFICENARLGGSKDGFLYHGQFFSGLDAKIRSKGEKGSLHPSLSDEVEAHIRDRKNVQFERALVKQTLVILLQNCRTGQDVYDALPNALHEALFVLVPEYRGLSRTRPEAWTIEDNERAKRQYAKLREKIEFYSVSKLLY